MFWHTFVGCGSSADLVSTAVLVYPACVQPGDQSEMSNIYHCSSVLRLLRCGFLLVMHELGSLPKPSYTDLKYPSPVLFFLYPPTPLSDWCCFFVAVCLAHSVDDHSSHR